MNKVELNKYIESICTQIPLVNSFYTQDVYEIWNTKEVKYGSVSFYVQSSSVGEYSTTWTGLIYYADRLLEDKSNLDQIHTDAVNVITSVMNTIYSDEDIVSINFPTNVELFEQSFVDWLAGGYATIQIETDNSINGCGFGYIKEEGGCEGAINELNKEIEELEDVIDGKNEIIASKDEEIEDLKDRLENNINPDFTSIGYNMDNAGDFFDREKDALRYAKKIRDEWVNPTTLRGYFSGNLNLVYMPMVDTSGISNMGYMFSNCRNLQNVPLLDTSSVTDMQSMFSYCDFLTNIPQLDTNNVTNMISMFYSCSSLTTIPLLDTSSVTNMGSMFNGCTYLTTVPQLDTSSVMNMQSMFNSCTHLESLPLLNFSSVITISSFFGYGNITTLTDLGGFTGLKIDWTGYGSLRMLPNLTVQSLLNVFNTIADVTELGGKKLEIGTTNLNKLTDEQKQIAINKGWTLS